MSLHASPPVQWPGAPPQLPPPARRSSAIWIVAVATAAVVVAAFAFIGGYGAARLAWSASDHTGSAGGVLGHATAAPADAPSGAATATTTPLVDHSGDLRRFLLTPQRGSQPWADPPGTNGLMSAFQEAANAPSPTGRLDFLRNSHFDVAAVATWFEGSTSVEIRLYRFKGADAMQRSNSAFAFFGGESGYASDDVERDNAMSHVVTALPNGHSLLYSYPADSRGLTHAYGLAVAGDIVIEMWVYQPGQLNLDRVQALLVQEWHKL